MTRENPNVKVLLLTVPNVVMLLARVVIYKHFNSVEYSVLNVRVLYSHSKNKSKTILELKITTTMVRPAYSLDLGREGIQPTLLSSSSGSDATGRPVDDNSNWAGKPGLEGSTGPSSHTPYMCVCQDVC